LVNPNTKLVDHHGNVLIFVGIDSYDDPGNIQRPTRNHTPSSSIRFASDQANGQDCDKANAKLL
jgi:hypothetical protein